MLKNSERKLRPKCSARMLFGPTVPAIKQVRDKDNADSASPPYPAGKTQGSTQFSQPAVVIWNLAPRIKERWPKRGTGQAVVRTGFRRTCGGAEVPTA